MNNLSENVFTYIFNSEILFMVDNTPRTFYRKWWFFIDYITISKIFDYTITKENINLLPHCVSRISWLSVCRVNKKWIGVHFGSLTHWYKWMIYDDEEYLNKNSEQNIEMDKLNKYQ